MVRVVILLLLKVMLFFLVTTNCVTVIFGSQYVSHLNHMHTASYRNILSWIWKR